MAGQQGFTMKIFEHMSGRDAYGKIIAEIARENERVVLLAADALGSTKGTAFYNNAPDRVFNMGIAESNMVTTAAGLAIAGKIPVVTGYGFLLAIHAAEQVRVDICYANKNVKLVATATGLAMGTGGSTHHCIEDVSIMRAFPNITIVSPASAIETAIATRACILGHIGPLYLRLIRGVTPEIYDSEDIGFEIGKAITLKEGKDITLIATGEPVYLALKTAKILEKEGINARVLNMHTVKPIDEKIILKATEETKGIVTIEEGNVIGGLGDAVGSVVYENDKTTKIRKIGIQDEYCKVGPTEALWEYYGISEDGIIKAVKSILKKRKK